MFASATAPLPVLLRPALIVVGVVTVSFAIALIAVRSIAVASFVTTIAVLLLTTTWVLAVPLIILGTWWLLVKLLRRRSGRRPLGKARFPGLVRAIGMWSLALLAVATGNAVVSGALWWPSRPQPVEAPAGQRQLPNVYVVLLDGYPGQEFLSSLGFDNQQFETELTELGLEIAPHGRSNYSMTWPTLASMFQMDYLENVAAIDGVPDHGRQQYRALGKAINDSPTVAVLEGAGYRVVGVASPHTEVTLSVGDRTYDYAGPTRFEEALLERSVLLGVTGSWGRDWVAQTHRDGVRWALSTLDEIASTGADGPEFVFDHVYSPHPPFVFQADGQARSLPACYPSCSIQRPSAQELGISERDYEAAVLGQVQAINELALDALAALVKRDPSAIVIVFSDHGTRHDVDGDPVEATSNFFASRVPGNPELFGSSPHLVNTFPTLLNHLLGTSYPLHDFRAWVSLDDQALELRPVP